MNRRTLLALISAGITLSLPGCTGTNDEKTPTPGGDPGTVPVASLKMTPVSDIEIAKRVTYRIDLEHRAAERQLVAAVITNGSETVTATNRPVPEKYPFVYNGSVYELSYEILTTNSARTFRLSLSSVDPPEHDQESIEYQHLPSVDKTVLEQYGWDDGGPFQTEAVEVVYSEDEITESILVPSPDPAIIKWQNDTMARVTIEDPTETEQRAYEYTAKQLHASAAEFGRSLRTDHTFELTDISEEQAAIVETAIEQEEGYRIQDGDPPDAFTRLINQFDNHPTITPVYTDDNDQSTISDSYLIQYNDTNYWTDLHIKETTQ